MPLIALSMNNSVKDFIASSAPFALSVYILPSDAIKSISVLKNLSFDQPDEYLKDLGWSSGSTLINNFMLFVLLLVLQIIDWVIFFIKGKQNR